MGDNWEKQIYKTRRRVRIMEGRDWSKWFKAAGIRALKTVAQAAIAAIGTTAVFHEVDWMLIGSTALLSGILSLLTSIAGIPEENL